MIAVKFHYVTTLLSTNTINNVVLKIVHFLNTSWPSVNSVFSHDMKIESFAKTHDIMQLVSLKNPGMVNGFCDDLI